MPKVLIDIPENFKYFKQCRHAMASAIDKGTPLDGLTNGEVMQMLFPNTELHWTNDCEYGLRPLDSNWIIWFKGDWWNAKWGEET